MSSREPSYEILAEDPGFDDRTLVLVNGDTFAVFDRQGCLRPGSGS